ncbi:MAG: hypothetical protein PVF47_10935 [Anaerolineae bacterium]
MENQLLLYLAWVLAAGLLGMVIAAIFAGWLQLARRLFLVPYIVLSTAFLYAFCRWSQIDLISLFTQNWHWGLIAGVIVGVFLVKNVMSQPASARSTGAGLLFDVLWVGLGYGAMDALFLNVMPVVVVWTGFSEAGWTAFWSGKIATGAIALLASLLVTLSYHLGYPEFRNRKVSMVLIGNTLITLAYLVSANPLGAVVSHATMHVAAVFRGPETMLQLPPHYPVPHQNLA